MTRSENYDKKWRREKGDFAVPCKVSMRWIQFSSAGSGRLPDGEYLQLWIMTEDAKGKPKRLCELVVTREDLQGALDLIERTPKG